MPTNAHRLGHLAAALAAAAVLSACRPSSPEAASPAVDEAPVADVEGTALPPTVAPVVVEGGSDDLDWTVEGEDATPSTTSAAGSEAARDYIAGGRTEPRTQRQPAGPATSAAATAALSRRDDAATPPPAPARSAPARAVATTEEDVAPRAPTAPARASSPQSAPPALPRDDDQARTLNQRAIALINAGRPADAVPLLERAVGVQPRDAEMLGNLGYAYMLTGRHDRARARLQAALDLSPTRSATWLNLGQTYAELGERESAVDAVVRGYRYSTRKPSVRSALQRAVDGERHSAAWREAAALALARIGN